MRFKTDENMPVEAADDLRQAGQDGCKNQDCSKKSSRKRRRPA